MKRFLTILVSATIVVFAFLGYALAFPPAAQADDDIAGLRHVVDMLLERVSALEEVLLPVDLTELEQRISDLEAAGQPLYLTVNCPEDSLGMTLAQIADKEGQVTITVEGFCEEDVTVWGDYITIKGAVPGDGLRSMHLRYTSSIELDQLTFIGGGLNAYDTASFVGSNLHISGAGYGIYVEKNATGDLYNSMIENSTIGVKATSGGVLCMFGGTIDTNSLHGVEAYFGGHVALQDVTVSNSDFSALSAREGGSIEISHSIIEYNAAGGSAISGGHLTIKDGSIVRNNGGGVGVHGGGTLWIMGGVTIADNSNHAVTGRAGGSINIGDVVIENNVSDAISLGGGATADLAGGTIIRNNLGHGIAISATSAATFFDDTVQVIGNTGTAVICGPAGLDDVALIVGAPGVISGNGSDTIECPQGFP